MSCFAKKSVLFDIDEIDVDYFRCRQEIKASINDLSFVHNESSVMQRCCSHTFFFHNIFVFIEESLKMSRVNNIF